MNPHFNTGNTHACKDDIFSKRKKIDFRCSSATKERWKDYAKSRNMTLSDLINYSVNQVVNANDRINQ